jgi:hypothetical protein
MTFRSKKEWAENLYYKAQLSLKWDNEAYRAIDFSQEACDLFVLAGDVKGYRKAKEQYLYFQSLLFDPMKGN